MKIKPFILGVSLAAGSVAFAFQPSLLSGSMNDPLQQGDPSRGRRVYVQKDCVECHAVMGSGGTIGPDLAEVGKGRSHHRLVTKLWDHLPLMVQSFAEEGMVWPEVSDEEMADLTAYLFYLNFFDKPGNYNLGKQQFTQKGCVNCHSIGGSGAQIGPALDKFGSSASSLDLVARMWSHGPAMLRSQRDRNVQIPKFQGAEVADILAYLKGSSMEATRTKFQRPGDQVLGRGIFEEKQCALCHAVKGEGQVVAADGSKVPGPDLSNVNLERSVPEFAGVLWNHGPMIWDTLIQRGAAIPPFSVDEIADLLAYLYFIDYHDENGDAAKGEELFAQRSCVECHLDQSAAESPGPSIQRLGEVVKYESFAAGLWNHGPLMLEKMESETIAWPNFTEEEMRNLTYYLGQLPDPEEEEDE